MSTEDEHSSGLVPSQSTALSRTERTSLVRRGTQDLAARAEAQQCYVRGRSLWHRELYVEAVGCFLRGIELDPSHAAIQFYLGLAYYTGDGVPKQDHTRAAYWWRRSAEQGDALSQHNLAVVYAHGEGVPQNYADAVEWYLKAAEQGLASAQFRSWYVVRRGPGCAPGSLSSLVRGFAKPPNKV